MGDEIERETFVIDNPDGSISLDAYAGKSRDELKAHCQELCMALGDWQIIAMTLAEGGKLHPEQQAKVDQLIEAYKD